jgi:single-stranded-DNA-specific exonuclease
MNRRSVAHSLTGRDWLEPVGDPALAADLAARFDLPEVVGRLLALRGVDLDGAAEFLHPRLRTALPDPSRLVDMDAAADRLARAVHEGERVGIISDYDVDGCTSAALVRRWAGAVGLPTVLRIPDRLADGYGPSVALVDALRAEGCTLILVLDAGVNAFTPLAHAAAAGVDVVVVDHHRPEAELPPARALVNPNRRDDTAGLGALAAVGVTFLLLVATNRALRAAGAFARTPEPALMGWLDLVAVGTVADVVPLLGLNRAYVQRGLEVLNRGGNAGLAALAAEAGVARPITAERIAFGLAPRLNAAGRLADAGLAAELLTTADPARAAVLAGELDRLNAERRRVEQGLQEAAAAMLAPQLAAEHRVLLAACEGWHPGVLGIVAGRLAERFHRPVFVAGIREGAATGSARGPEGFDIGAALHAAGAAGLTLKAGGHARAGGFTVAPDRLEAFHAVLEERAGTPVPPPLHVDAAVAVGGASGTLLRALAKLEPYGERHPPPRLRVVGGRIAHVRVVGERHLKVRCVGADGRRLDAIAFRAVGGELESALARAVSLPAVQLAGRLRADDYRGNGAVQLVLEDVAPET